MEGEKGLKYQEGARVVRGKIEYSVNGRALERAGQYLIHQKTYLLYIYLHV